ncbi:MULTISPECIES: Tad domain-containing protein [unclassified Pseudoalteromonas]|uniref:Tad domain-containing protein n=1 Tax=unclassified Pseudoalteromonas TaxID=194690 RepID=UPI000CF6B7B5|nr:MULTISPECIES: Tad domain-containing protein [unclassified Pseudoalteromonas]
MHKEKGQSLVLGLIFLSIIVLSLLYLFNVSQQNLHKTRLQNFSDAAALSGAQLLARDLNYKAYTNRAMVANHVSVAQYVGLASWGNMTEETTRNISRIMYFIPPAAAIASAIESAVTQINQYMQPVLEYAVMFTDGVNRLLSRSQQLMSSATMVAAVDTTNKVLKENNQNADIDTISALGVANYVARDWVSFQGRFDRRDNTGRYDDHFNLIVDSRDPFSKKRSFNWPFPFSAHLFPVKYKAKQAGGTELFNNGERDAETWSGMDTFSFHFHRFSCKRFRCKWRGGERPVGWGAAHAGDDQDTTNYTARHYYGRSRAINRKASRYAYTNESEMNNAYSGLQPFYDIKQSQNKNVAPKFTIAVSQKRKNIRTSEQLNIGTGGPAQTNVNLEEHTATPDGELLVLSKAKIYYFRDRALWGRSDSKWEYGNLYNPYWQVTLDDTTNGERGMVAALAFAAQEK